MENELPPWKIFTKAISLIWEKRLFALYISFPVILLYTVTGVAMDLGMIETPTPDLLNEQGPQEPSPGQMLWSLPFGLLLSFLFAGVAVYWHRSILLGEHAVGTIPLRFDRVLWRYILYAIGMILWMLMFGLTFGVIFGVLGGILSVAGADTTVGAMLFVAFLPFLIFLAIVMFRLSLTLPAAAIGLEDFGFRKAWEISRGHNWQILAIVLLMFGLSILIGLTLGALLLIFGLPALALFASLPKSLTLSLEAVFYAAQMLISIGVLSLTFAYLTYEGPRGGAVARR